MEILHCRPSTRFKVLTSLFCRDSLPVKIFFTFDDHCKGLLSLTVGRHEPVSAAELRRWEDVLICTEYMIALRVISPIAS